MRYLITAFITAFVIVSIGDDFRESGGWVFMYIAPALLYAFDKWKQYKDKVRTQNAESERKKEQAREKKLEELLSNKQIPWDELEGKYKD